MLEETSYMSEKWPLRLQRILEEMRQLDQVVELKTELSAEVFQQRVQAKLELQKVRERLFSEALSIVISCAPKSISSLFHAIEQEEFRLMCAKKEESSMRDEILKTVGHFD